MLYKLETLDDNEYADKAPLILFAGITGSKAGFVHLAQYLEPGRPVYVFVPTRDSEGYQSLKDAAKECYSQLFGRNGKLFHLHAEDSVEFGAYSSGAPLAFEVAKLAELRNRKISKFCALDADMSRPLGNLSKEDKSHTLLALFKTVFKRHRELLGDEKVAEQLKLAELEHKLTADEVKKAINDFDEVLPDEQVEKLNAIVEAHCMIVKPDVSNERLLADLINLSHTVKNQIMLQLDYKPEGTISCPITVFCAEKVEDENQGGWKKREEGAPGNQLGWEKLYSGPRDSFNVILLKDQTHFSFLQMPFVEHFASKILGPLLRVAENLMQKTIVHVGSPPSAASASSSKFLQDFGRTMRNRSESAPNPPPYRETPAEISSKHDSGSRSGASTPILVP